ncbi:hypothetical protein [Rhodococcus triatomae]|nr:hypothetical protein G419_25362 [Rhodococcus triatomae BKS 15-14]
MLKTILDWLTPETIQALGVAFAGAITAWLGRETILRKRLQGEFDELKKSLAKVQDLLKLATRYIRDLRSHNTNLANLLRQHAPDVEVPNEPQLPRELDEEL